MERTRTVCFVKRNGFVSNLRNRAATCRSERGVARIGRPRVEGDREQEIFDATMAILGEVGFDMLTMDAVAARAKASKATLYRRWANKASLVIAAMKDDKGPHEIADTGTLRGDLVGTFCGPGGLEDAESVARFTSVMTAIATNPEFADTFRTEILEHKLDDSRLIWERAKARGEVRDDLDLTLIEPAAAGILLHRVVVLGETLDRELITRVIDQIILPAAGVTSSVSTH